MENLELISKYFKGEVTDAEKAMVEDWLKADEGNVVFFNELKKTWEATGNLIHPIRIDKEKAWRSIQQKIKEEQKIIPINAKSTNYTTWLFRVAAILIVGFFATWLVMKNNSNAELMVAQTTDQEKVITLPDSTKIFLNKNSKLTYPKEFAQNTRNVDLEGEAFFEVTKNPEKPFVIKNKDFSIKVLGTSFNVFAYDGSNKAIVTVVTGKVAFSDTKGNSQLLVKDEVGVLNKSTHQLNKTANLNSNFLSWKTKKLEFSDTGFPEVIETLEKYFSIKIEVKEKNILKCKFTGYFENPTLQDVLKVLEKTLMLKTVVNEKQIVITGAGC